MNYLLSFQKTYTSHLLLAATLSIILIGFFGSINILLITMLPITFWWWIAMVLALFATMRFLALFIAKFPVHRIFEAFVTGIIIQLSLLVIQLLI